MTDEKAPKPSSKDDATPVRFKLNGPHTHQGQEKKAGDEITLRKRQAKHLEADGRGTIVSGSVHD